MKKQEIKNLALNKKVVSNFEITKIKGGHGTVDHKTGCVDNCDLK
ncbi:hypothetical protein [Kordia aestuariivivens]|nr:hypothetical protein [Kordia aestuariivivens]